MIMVSIVYIMPLACVTSNLLDLNIFNLLIPWVNKRCSVFSLINIDIYIYNY